MARAEPLGPATALSRARTCYIEVESFGNFRVLVNGQVGPPIRSRYARELLLAMSMVRGSVRREELIDKLLPEIADHRQGRRRLTREMSRLQSAFDVALWDTTPEIVAVHHDVHLSSDLGRFLDQDPVVRAEHASRRRHRLVSLARIADCGPCLGGHGSRWSEDIRSQVAARELVIRQELATSLSPADQPAALKHAQRWAELDPFVDDAHRAVLRLTQAVLGPLEARRYLEHWNALYQSGLGVDRPDVLADELNEADEGRPLLRQELAALEDELRQLSDNDERWRLLLEMDDVVRIIGDGPRRQEVLEQLIKMAGELDRLAEVTWRQAEFALFSGDVERATNLADACGPATELPGCYDRSVPAMEAVTRAQIHWYRGQCAEALTAAEEAIRQCDEAMVGVEIEARLWISRILEHTGDLGEAREASLHALDLANRSGIDHYTAEALSVVGWCLAKTDHSGEAQSTLDQAAELAERLECNVVRATALAALGVMNYMNRRPATSYAQLAEAAELSDRIGHVTAFARWSLNAVGALDLTGAISLRRQHIEQVRVLSSTSHDHGLKAKLSYVEGWMELSLDNPRGALAKCTEALTHLEQIDQPAQRLYTQLLTVTALSEAGSTSDAVQLATDLLTESKKHDLPPYLQAGFDAALGCALVKEGSTADGMALLEEFMTHRNPSQILDAPEYGVYFEGASKLGMVEECEALARTTCRMVDNLRQDLTDDQWELAKKQSFYIRRILPILDSVGYC